MFRCVADTFIYILGIQLKLVSRWSSQQVGAECQAANGHIHCELMQKSDLGPFQFLLHESQYKLFQMLSLSPKHLQFATNQCFQNDFVAHSIRLYIYVGRHCIVTWCLFFPSCLRHYIHITCDYLSKIVLCFFV